MPNYIKTHSQYVLKKKHQNTNDGTIYERDWVTIGGLNQFSKDQVPIYQSGNFLITVNNGGNTTRNILNSNWYENSKNGEVWTLDIAEEMLEGETTNDTQIVIKQDYYSLRDFAYFGSCSELVRASINDIVSRFPGELCTAVGVDGEKVTVTYTARVVDSGGTVVRDYQELGNGKYLLENPFGIDIHTQSLGNMEGVNPLKYFCNDGYKNYTINGVDIQSWNVTATTESCPGDCKFIIKLNSATVYAYVGDGGSLYYFTDGSGFHIKPKDKFYTQFINSLDSFQKVLMNTSTEPKYKATFEVIEENDYGYYTTVKDFIFPTDNSGYNIGSSSIKFEQYLNSLSTVAAFYDERFCDNLYRSLTHEAIKNFDWTFTREYSDGEEEEYVVGGDKIAKILRLYGRMFDELKMYIDNMSNANKVTYDDASNLPDYFLTDALENDGWNIVNIYPFKWENNKGSVNMDSNCTVSQPYKHKETPHFDTCNGKENWNEGESSVKYEKGAEKGVLRHLIKRYNSDREYSVTEVNNVFLRLLKLNSRRIFQSKGTLSGVEMILGMFGLKSERWCKKRGITSYDYKITEYTSETNSITDNYVESKGMPLIDWYNSTKTINYGTSDYINGIYTPYQGLPVAYEELSDGSRKLYPYFDKNGLYDGNPYYQMNGGWLKKMYKKEDENVYKPYSFNNEGELVSGDTIDGYTETLRTVKSVDTIKDLVLLPISTLKDGDIYYVNDLSGEYAIVDGVIYTLKYDNNNRYFSTYIYNNSVRIGDEIFYNNVSVANPNYSGNRNYVSLEGKRNNTEIRVYVDDGGVLASNDVSSVSLNTILSEGKLQGVNNQTNYFIINDISNKSSFGSDGWQQLTTNSEKYNKLNSIIDNFKGNNPHCGNGKYDDGAEYFRYFAQLFKYAYENDLFDKRCYGTDFYNDEYDKISKIGFNNLMDDICEDNYNYSADTKIHYFGDIINENGTETHVTVGQVNRVHPNSGGIYQVNEDNTNLILNNKKIVIEFTLPNKAQTCDGGNLAELKYYDYVINNYLTQLLPSTCICEIKLN